MIEKPCAFPVKPLSFHTWGSRQIGTRCCESALHLLNGQGLLRLTVQEHVEIELSYEVSVLEASLPLYSVRSTPKLEIGLKPKMPKWRSTQLSQFLREGNTFPRDLRAYKIPSIDASYRVERKYECAILSHGVLRGPCFNQLLQTSWK